MADTIKLPVIGEVKKGWVWAGGGVVALIGVWTYVRHRNSAASDSASTAVADTASAAIDPATGYPQGSPQDVAALQAQDDGGDVYGSAGAPTSGELYYDPSDGLYDLTSPYTGTGTGSATANTGPGTFTDNAYWTQYAVQNIQGYSAEQVQGALASYLSGLGLTTTQMSIYQTAIAVAGPAPEPPATPAHLATGSGSGGGSGTAKITVPNVVGAAQEQAYQVLSSVGLHPSGQAPVHGETRIVTAEDPKAGTQVDKGTTVKLSSDIKK